MADERPAPNRFSKAFPSFDIQYSNSAVRCSVRPAAAKTASLIIKKPYQSEIMAIIYLINHSTSKLFNEV
jgi:hypothetical protein